MKKQLCMILALWLGATCAYADENPLIMLQGVVNEVMRELKKPNNDYKKNSDALFSLVDHHILPHVDFVEMGRWVAGRNAWQKASPEVREKFIKAFKTVVVRTYATALLHYRNQTVEFLPSRESYEGQTRIKVSSLIKDVDKGSTRIDYYLIKHDSKWQVYDIIIEGVSLVKGYEAQYGDDIRAKGLESVIPKLLHNKNYKRAA